MDVVSKLGHLHNINTKTNKNQKDSQVLEASKGFAKMFVKQYLELGLKTNTKDPLVGGGQSMEIFNSLMIEEYSKVLSEPGSLGITEIVYRELEKNKGGVENE